MDRSSLAHAVTAWYAAHARDLPWRAAGVSPWGVMVSEFMLQQTPVSRAIEPWTQWLARWPTPAALAAESTGEAVRAWGRLGYPRRALRLHQAATAIVEHHGGEVPSDVDALRQLPGVGEYTAAAIAAFAHGRRALVLDTNVRRVLARLDAGTQSPPASLTRDERERAARWLPESDDEAARWSVAAMELGAQLCTATNPACGKCPVSGACRWLARGRPADGLRRTPQPYAGTDRQARGALLAALRQADSPLPHATLLARWTVDRAQAERALAGLVADGLVQVAEPGHYRL
ncbi:MAG: A/G-specific adenine glycosylase [Propionicimonas sp.]|nr:A/G-specific adenine glycosylase [Propionicimonas sp.]